MLLLSYHHCSVSLSDSLKCFFFLASLVPASALNSNRERLQADICKYCTFPLIINEERQLSGIWGTFKTKKYHVECFQNYVGPRCEHCFDVVFANAENGYSGRWISRPSDGALLHQECYLFLLAKNIRVRSRAPIESSLSLGYMSKHAPDKMALPGYKVTSNEKGTIQQRSNGGGGGGGGGGGI